VVEVVGERVERLRVVEVGDGDLPVGDRARRVVQARDAAGDAVPGEDVAGDASDLVALDELRTLEVRE
jgi:hypothetical protein